jgi:enamine deaminase RidA (YjgF/YER057c/UK114 family)
MTAPCANDPVAVRAGDLLPISRLTAVAEDGVVARAVPDPRQPSFSPPIEAQMEHILASALCTAAGRWLANVVRIQQFHTSFADFRAACRVWQRRLPGVPLPISALAIPLPIAVSGASAQPDLRGHAPSTS